MTVLGPVAPQELGLTSMHEHVFCDISCYRREYADQLRPADEEVWTAPYGPQLRGVLEHHGFFLNHDNCRLDDPAAMELELRAFAASGGGALLDLSGDGLRLMPEELAGVSERAGVHVVASTGWYVEASWPQEIHRLSERELAGRMVAELTEGIAGTGVRAGHIGEIGVTDLSAGQERVLRAAACASAQTGAAVTVHPGFGIGSDGRRIADILIGAGAEPSRVVIAHGDAYFAEHRADRLALDDGAWAISTSYHEELLARGVNLSVDCFGHRWNVERGGWVMESDHQRLAGLVRLVRAGFSRQIVVGTDICMKLLTRAGGGRGYVRLTEDVLPFLRRLGVSDHDIRAMTVETPARLLTLV
jgi:phosphotriesterase-related protein